MTALEAPGGPAPRRDGQRGRSDGWHLATVGGVPVVLARSWLIIAAGIAVLFGPQVARVDPGTGPVAAYSVALLYAVLLLLSVLVHELAHAVSASLFSMSPTRIVLTLWGGHTSFARDAPTPWASFVVSAAGPASNVVLAVALYWGLGRTTLPAVGQLLLFAVVLSNAFVGVTNALPGLPLDGGRMLEALVWGVSGDRDRATVVAASVGRVVAVAVPVAAALFLLSDGSLDGDVLTLGWSALVGALLWTSSGGELAYAHGRRRAMGADVRTLVTTSVVVPASRALADVGAPAGLPVVLVDEGGLPVGVLDPAAAASVPPERRDVVPASAAALALHPGAVVEVSTSGQELFDRLGSLPPEPWVVVRTGPGGAPEVLGLLLAGDVAAAMGAPRQRGRAPRPT